MWYILAMQCKICKQEFTPNKYRPSQEVCSKPECQHLRQILNEKEWRKKNPDYFKYLDQETYWRENRRRYNKLWKATHKAYITAYEENHKEQRRVYMREYMREYRIKNRAVKGNKS